MKKKIFITGGHVTPALAVIDQLSEVDVVFIGRKYAMEGDRNVSAEYKLITERGIPFLPITAGRLQRSFTARTLPSLLKIPIGFVQSFVYCVRYRPQLIVSFGGYVALPVAVAGAMLGIPIITHEQTIAPGLANRLIARIARKVCVTFEETARLFDSYKVVVTGLPIRQELFSEQTHPNYVMPEKSYPLLYITGGSLGAQSLNKLVFPIVSELTKHFTVIHQVGEPSLTEAKKIKQSRYIVEPYIPVRSLSWILKHASLVIGRSGANTVVELAVFGKIALLVPLPWSAGNEQFLHAQWLVKHGGAMCESQNGLTPEKLFIKIRTAWDNRKDLEKRADVLKQKMPHDGAKRVASQIALLLH